MSKSQARGALGVPEMLRGSVVTHRRRRGEPTGRCAPGGRLHEPVGLSYAQARRTGLVMLEPEEVDAVRAATERFREARADLEAQAEANLAALLARRGRARR